MTGKRYNAPEYAGYKREVIGRDEDGRLIFGERERLPVVDGFDEDQKDDESDEE